jgi:hypothetical protein
MTLQIPIEVEQLARLVAIKTGKTPDDVVKEAVEARAAALGVPTTPRRPFDEARVRAIIERVAGRPLRDARSAEDILGYNERGTWD